MTAPSTRAATIAALNDRFRREAATFGRASVPGQCVLTRGVADLGPEVQLDISWRVVAFDDFGEDNDPYGEHDFGAIDHPTAGKLFWKIDVYADSTCQSGSEHSHDPTRSYRVMTIMLAEEY